MPFHRCSYGLLILIAALTPSAANGQTETQPASALKNTMDTLVTTEWLSQHLNDPDLVVLDCTVLMLPNESGGFQGVCGRTSYGGGHIPTAGFADLTGALCDVESPMSHALPTPERFCSVMGSLGVGDESRVVLYDGNLSVWAARVWWMLRWVGFDRAAVLDGGLRVWTSEGRPLSTEPAGHQERELTPDPRPSLIADREEVAAAINDDSVFLIDTMPEPHFRGKMVLYDRPGHIPSASNVSAMALLDEKGRYKPMDELAEWFDGDRSARFITYCGAGIAASSNAFIMSRLGFKDVAVYMASLQEWAADPANPMVVE